MKKKKWKVLGYICSGILIFPLLLFILISHILRCIDEMSEWIYWIKGGYIDVDMYTAK